jgi:hypothetical protein
MDVCLFTDAVAGKTVGGVGLVLVGGSLLAPTFNYEHRHPLPGNMNQTQAELFAILTGLSVLGHTLESHGIKETDVFLRAYTDSKAALHAIATASDQKEKKVRLLCKRIIRLAAGHYFKPPGGGASFEFLSTRARPSEDEGMRRVENLRRAHELSRWAKSMMKSLS